MSGIGGIYNICNDKVNLDLLVKMSNTIKHRAPNVEEITLLNSKSANVLFQGDSSQLSAGYSANLALIERRDNEKSNSCTGDKIWLTFDGKIYNYKDIRSELSDKGYVFITNDVSELIKHAYLEWGVECQKKFRGMWSFALWDSREKQLFC